MKKILSIALVALCFLVKAPVNAQTPVVLYFDASPNENFPTLAQANISFYHLVSPDTGIYEIKYHVIGGVDSVIQKPLIINPGGMISNSYNHTVLLHDLIPNQKYVVDYKFTSKSNLYTSTDTFKTEETKKPQAHMMYPEASYNTSLVLKGEVYCFGLPTTAYFQYGKGGKFTLNSTPQILDEENMKLIFSDSISGLEPGTIYNIRVISENAKGIYVSEVAFFGTSGLALGIKELEIDDLKIFPNPCTNSFTINLPNNTKGSASLSSLDGKLIWQKEIASKQVVNTESLEKGIYFITFENEAGKATKKILIE